jgi:hypothetical protein
LPYSVTETGNPIVGVAIHFFPLSGLNPDDPDEYPLMIQYKKTANSNGMAITKTQAHHCSKGSSWFCGALSRR